MALVGDKVCVNHPHTTAASRCVTCFKPLCRECVMKRNAQDFCSDECALNHVGTDISISEFKEKERRRTRAKLVKKFILIVILTVVGFVAYRYWIDNKEKVRKTTRQLKIKTIELKHKLGNKPK